MTRIVLESEDSKDVLLIRELADRLKIKYSILTSTKGEKAEREKLKHYYQVIDKGIDVSNFGDPSIWQRNTRRDRKVDFA